MSAEDGEVLGQAETWILADRTSDAVQLLDDYLMLSPGDRRAHYLLGQARFEQGRYAEARQHFERAVELDDSHPMTHLWLGKVLAEEIERANVFAKLPLAKRLLAGFQRAVELDPQSVPAHTALARFHLEAPAMAGGSEERLRFHIQRLHELDGAAAHRLEARLQLRQENPEAAERHLRQAVELAPKDGETYADLGGLLLRQERIDAALPLLQRAVELDPRQHGAHFHLGTAALQVEPPRREIARRAFSTYLLRHPTHDLPQLSDAWLRLGRLEEALGDVDEARRSYRQVLNLRPDHPEARQAIERLASP